ncbi:MAG: type II secretion system protein GspE, partial [Lachnospiraceae bacterium]|nr:type II secretion system protein GspE [Lachnospiraceae bacterium]
MVEYGRRKVRLGDALVKDGMISEEQLQKALELQKGSGRKLGETLIDAGMVTEENIARVLSKQLGYESIDLQNISVSKDVLDLVTPSVLKKNRVLPIEYAPDNMNILRVAMADPLDLDAMDDISIITGCQV